MTELNLSKGGTAYTAPVTLPPGSASQPSLRWSNASIGFWQSGTAQLSLVFSGTSVADFNALGVAFTDLSSSTFQTVTLVSSTLRVTTPVVPANASSAGSAGQIAWDSGYVYVCVATNTWKRAAIATW